MGHNSRTAATPSPHPEQTRDLSSAPTPREIAGLVQLIAEVIHGQRPPQVLAPVGTHQLRAALLSVPIDRTGNVQPRAVHTIYTNRHDDTIHVTATYTHPDGVRALAITLVHPGRGWRLRQFARADIPTPIEAASV